MPDSKKIPKSAMTAFALLLAAHEQQKQELARAVCEELGLPMESKFDLQQGTVTAPESDA